MSTNFSTSVTVQVIGASGLPSTSRFHRPNTFVTVKVGSKAYKTRKHANTQSPHWDESFSFQDVHPFDFLELRLADAGTITDSVLGTLSKTIHEYFEDQLVQGDSDLSYPLIRPASSPYGSGAPSQITLTCRIKSGSQSTFSDMERSYIQLQRDAGKMRPDISALDTSSSSNPWTDVLSSLDSLVKNIDVLSRIHPYAELAWALLSAAYKFVRAQTVRDAKIEILVDVISQMYSFMRDADPVPKIQSLADIIETLTKQTCQCAVFVKDYSENSFLGRALKYSVGDVEEKIDQFIYSFYKLQSGLGIALNLQSAINLGHIEKKVDHTLIRAHLPYVQAGWDPEEQCLPGTRTHILNEITTWLLDGSGSASSNVFWLTGPSGVGKTSIAHSVANICADIGVLGGSFFFKRDIAERSRPDAVLKTLAIDLSAFNANYREALVKVVEDHPSLGPLSVQFEKLFQEPLNTITGIGRTVIVIDAMNECGNAESRAQLLNILTSRTSRLPSTIRIFITSRLEEDVDRALTESTSCLRRPLTTREESNASDISLYLQHQLSRLAKRHRIPAGWPDPKERTQLASRAEGLFIWASTVCKILADDPNPQEKLKDLLVATEGGSGLPALDTLYAAILNQMRHWDDAGFSFAFKLVMSIILTARNPLSGFAIQSLIGDRLGRFSVDYFINRLDSVLMSDTGSIRILHSSFRDFLTDSARCKDYRQHVDHHQEQIALGCLDSMNRDLKRYVYDCGDLRAVTISEDLRLRDIREQIPEHVAYASTSWIYHVLQLEASNPGLEDSLYNFFTKQLLHWLQVISILGYRHSPMRLLELEGWIRTKVFAHIGLRSLVQDTLYFITEFMDLIVSNPLQIYTSTIPFTPTATTIYQHYASPDPSQPILKYGARKTWLRRSTLERHRSWVAALAWSPNGSVLVSASDDHTLRLWHPARSSSYLTFVLKGHTQSVLCTGFAPNGQFVISGSRDTTVRIWNRSTGMPISRFTLHNSAVQAVALGRNGLMASGASDGQICICQLNNMVDVSSCLTLEQPDPVSCLAFSPDASRILTGSGKHLRMWQCSNGELLGVLIGHQFPVTCITYTLDGMLAASGSGDFLSAEGDVRLWDKDGILVRVFETFSQVYSVAFSRDSSRLLAGCWDTEVFSWSIRDWSCGPHRMIAASGSTATAIACSEDSIACGSLDGIIRLRDPSTGFCTGDPGKDTSRDIKTVLLAFSQNGSHLANALANDSVVILDVANGTEKTMIAADPDRNISCMAYTPDSRLLALGCLGGIIELWDTMENRRVDTIATGHSDIHFLKFSPLGTLLISAEKLNLAFSDAQLWNFAEKRLIAHIRDEDYMTSGSVDTLCFSADGTRMGACVAGIQLPDSGEPDEMFLNGEFGFRIWDDLHRYPTVCHTLVLSEVSIKRPALHRPLITFPVDAAFSSDGRYIWIRKLDGQVRVGDLITGVWDSEPSLSHEQSPLGLWAMESYGWVSDGFGRRAFMLPESYLRSSVQARHGAMIAVSSRSGPAIVEYSSPPSLL